MVDDKKLYQRPNIITNIKRVLSLPCHLDGVMYLELAAEAAIDLAIQIADPDLKEIYHHVTGEPLVHSLRSGINKATEVKNINKTRVIRALGKGLGTYDSIVWALFLFYATKDALFDSTSQFLRQDPCQTGARPGDGIPWISALHPNGIPGEADFQFPPGSNYYPVAPSAVTLTAANHWTGTVAASTRWRLDEFTYVPVSASVVFRPFFETQVYVVDKFFNGDPDKPTSDDWNHIFARYQAAGARDGELSMEFAWSNSTVPPYTQAFLDGSSHCFLSGG